MQTVASPSSTFTGARLTRRLRAGDAVRGSALAALLVAAAWLGGCATPQPDAPSTTTQAASASATSPAPPPAPAPPPPPVGPDASAAIARAAMSIQRVAQAAEPAPRAAPAEGQIDFPDACIHGPRLTVAFVGDILVHEPLQEQAVAHPERFASLWAPVADVLASADLTYGNFEGVSAPGLRAGPRQVEDPGFVYDDSVYTGFPAFNYHPYLIDDLVAGGFDVVSTANNHATDRGSQGIDMTLDALAARGLAATGTRRSDAPDDAPWFTITEAAGFRVAWLACTKHTNGREDHGQVLFCYGSGDGDRASDPPNPVVLAQVQALAARDDVDAVIVTPHFGKSYQARQGEGQERFARAALEAGALAVIGSHVHNLQPWERHTTADGREGFILYSLGNFVSAQGGTDRRSTVILLLGLTRGARDGRVRLNGARFVPIYMTKTDEGRQVVAVDRTEDGIPSARRHIGGRLGAANFVDPDGPLRTNPRCHASDDASSDAAP